VTTDPSALAALLDSPAYRAVLAEAVRRAGLTLDPVEHPALARIHTTSLDLAGVTVEEVAAVVAAQPEVLARFVALKVAAYAEDTEEEGAQRDPGDDDNIVVLDPTPGFLVGHALELVLLTDRPDELAPYARRRRIPYAARCAREVRALYGEAIRAGADPS
jgi:hypothetical protein